MKGSVFLVQLDKTGSDLIFGALFDLGVDCHLVHGLVVLHGRDRHGLARQTQGIAGLDGGELREHADVLRSRSWRFRCWVLAPSGRTYVAELFGVARADVDEGHGVLDVAGNDLEVGVLAVLVSRGVEYEDHGAALRVNLEFLGIALSSSTCAIALPLRGVGRELDEVDSRFVVPRPCKRSRRRPA